jgi:hypothetical protein
MIAALGVALIASMGPTQQVAVADTTEPAVRLTVQGSGVFDPGDRAHVRVHVRDDSYVVVLQSAPDGRVVILFPRHPDDNDFVRAGSDFEVVGPAAGQASFTVADVGGTGTIVAAVSKDPYHFDGLTVNGNWDYRALPDTVSANPEAVLTGVVQRMSTSSSRFDYDLVNYTVTRPYNRSRSSVVYDDGSPGSSVYAYNEPYPYYGYVGPGWYDPWYPAWGWGLAIGWGWGWGWGYPYYGGFYGGGYYGYRSLAAYRAPYGGGPFRGLRPLAVANAGVRPGLFAATRVGAFGGASSAARGGVLASSGVRAVALQSRVAGSSTVFSQVQRASAAATPGTGRVVYRGASTSEAVSSARVSVSDRASGVSTGVRSTGGGAAQGYRVAPAASQGYGSYGGAEARGNVAASTRSGGSSGYRGGGGGGGGGARGGGGGGHGGGGGGGHR